MQMKAQDYSQLVDWYLTETETADEMNNLS